MHIISNEFEFQPDRTTDYGVSCPWASKTFPIDLLWENGVSVLACSFFDWIIIKVAGNQDRHKSSVKFDFGPNQTTHFGVTCPWVTKISHFRTWISLKPVGQSWSNFMCSIIGVGERLHKVSGQIDLAHWTQVSDRCPLGYLFFFSAKISSPFVIAIWAYQLMPRLIWVFAGHTDHFVRFVMRRLKLSCGLKLILCWPT